MKAGSGSGPGISFREEYNKMNLFYLKCFQVVAQENHITRASQILNIAQPALSNIISKIEKEFDMPLFDRVGRQIQLNQSGQILLSHVDVILDEWETAESRMQQAKRESETQVKIAVTGQLFPQQLILGFKMKYPSIVIKQSIVMNGEIASALHLQKNDFVISSIPIEDDDINSCEVKTEELYLLVRDDHPFSKREYVGTDELNGLPIITLPGGYAFRTMIDSFFSTYSIRLNVVFECFPSQFGELVSQGVGAAFVTETSVRQHYYPANTVAVPILPAFMRTLYLLYEKAHTFSKAGKAFYNYVLQNQDKL